MKHPQHILAFDKRGFNFDGMEGLITMSPKTFFESAAACLFIGRREELEADERFGQVLPYIVLYQRHADRFQVFVYQRTKKVGEQRLAGLMSVGTGGHVDLFDVVAKDSVIDFIATMAGAIARELNEEVGFIHNATNDALSFDQLRAAETERPLFPTFAGIIKDDSNSVGRVHFGVVMAMEIPAGYSPQCIEDELTTVGMVEPHAALAKGEGAFENWSKIVLENIGVILK
jgi:predicted NUDIX family phosphoesterase